ncbi:F-box-like/WD repeat-containing protein TBL1XR1-A-like, partial [Trifolium medium]|nr:F-box-like/WD repeat-containing protein TBL1XR1-A-like [Trifolium medium]
MSHATYNLWHARLGHPHHDSLKTALQICNVSVPSKPHVDVCTACCLGKSHRLYAPLSNTVYHQPLELVVCDLWGPAPVKSSSGFTYFLTCVDA